MKHKGLFITFEGCEGSGKSSLARYAYQYLKKRRYPVVLTREPGGTKLGEQIRDLLLNVATSNLDGVGELLLYCAARQQIVKEVIRPALMTGKIILCDRFADSTRAYQGFGERIDKRLIEKVIRIATGGLQPNITFLADVPVELGLKRAGRGDRIEKKSLVFHRRVRTGFLSLAKKHKKRFVVIDSRGTIDPMKVKVKEKLDAILH